jgi:hypothetical protein
MGPGVRPMSILRLFSRRRIWPSTRGCTAAMVGDVERGLPVPRIISFSWTSPSLLAGEKSVTRRDWDDDYARQFRKGMEVLAYDRSPRQGGKMIARLRLTDDARYEADADAPESDWAAEGFQWFQNRYGPRLKNGRDVSLDGFNDWRASGGSSWVIRFEVLEFVRQEAA